MTTFLIIAGVILVIVLLFIFAKSAAREANRIWIEADFHAESLNENINAVNHLIHDRDLEATKAERKGARYKARANEVAGKQTPLWKAYSGATRKRR